MARSIVHWKLSKAKAYVCEKVLKIGVEKDLYAIRHVSRGDHIVVGVYDIERACIFSDGFCDVKRNNSSWWTQNMPDNSSIMVYAPTNQEKDDGITYEIKIHDAYDQLQPIMVGLNADFKKMKKMRKELENIAQNVSTKKV